MNTSDFLVLNLEKEINEGETVVQGTSTFIPLVATRMAMIKKRIKLIGGFYYMPEINPRIPSTFSFKNFKGGEALGLTGFLDLLTEKKIDLEFLRPAQVDKYGNMNNTVIGSYDNPKIRFPGGMGVDDVIHFTKRVILYVPEHSKKVFVEKVDFVTASGWNRGKGPDKIITNMCTFEFIDKKITLTRINPNFSLGDIKLNTGFEFEVGKNISWMTTENEEGKKVLSIIDPLKIRDLEIKEKRREVIDKLIELEGD